VETPKVAYIPTKNVGTYAPPAERRKNLSHANLLTHVIFSTMDRAPLITVARHDDLLAHWGGMVWELGLLLTRILVLWQVRLCRPVLRKGSAFPAFALFFLVARRGYASPVEAQPQPKTRNEI
jgi:hypothetical protein